MQTGLPTQAAGALLVNRFGERYLYEANRDTFSRTGAEALFTRHFGEALGRENRFYIIVGTDSGLLPGYLESRGIPRGSRYLFVELPDILDTLETHQLLPRTSDRIHYTSPEHCFDIARELGLVDYLYVDAASVHLSLAASDAFIAEYRLVTQDVQDALDSHRWEITQGLGTDYFFDMMLTNLAENRLPAGLLTRNRFTGKTAVLLAGGPSLDSILPWVQTRRDDLVVIAVSRVCRKLNEQGLLPDIVVSIDPTDWSFDISKDLLDFPDQVILVNANHVNPKLLGQWPHRSCYLGQRFPWPTQRNPDNIPTSGPTVTNSALMLATDMGFSQIVLGGVDLCLSPEGYTHASGSNEHQAGPALGHVGLKVETNDGRSAETRHDFAHAINSLSAQARAAQSLGCRFINPAPGAARVEGVQHLELDDIEIEPLAQPAHDFLLKALPPEDDASLGDDLKTVLRELEGRRNEFEKIAMLAGEAFRYNDLLFSDDANLKHKKRLARAEKTMDDEHEAMMTFIKKYALPRFLKLDRPDEELEWTDQEGAETASRYYKTVRDCAGELIQRLDEAAARVRSRLEEIATDTDLNRLQQQWRQDRQPGRVRAWLARHPERALSLSEQEQAIVDSLLQEYRAIIDERDTGHARKIRKESDLGAVRSKALLLFQQQDKDGLRQLLAGLEQHPQMEAEVYRLLTSGYLAELEQDAAAALQAYQSITEGPLLEDSLKRIAYLSLDLYDLSTAALALDCLSQLSPSYLTQYGDVLRLDNKLSEAADAYTQYLDNAPDDLATAIKLGQLHQGAGNAEVALQIFDYVLERDPANQAARQLRDDMERTA